MSSWLTSIKKTVYGLTDAQVFLKDATNNDQWGPTTKQYQQIIQYTYHYQECREIMDFLYKRLSEDGKNWREIYKSLLVLDNILKNGSEEAVNIALGRIVEVKTLQSFQKIDEDGKDVGINIRERSKQIVELLTDNDYLKQARITAKNQKKDYGGIGNYGGMSSSSYGNYSSNTTSFSSDDFNSFNKPTSTYGGYHDEPQPTTSTTYSNNSQPTYGRPGTYKDNVVEQKQIQRDPSPVSQVINNQSTNPQPNLFDFDSTPSQSSQQKPLQTNTNLFDMMNTNQSTQQQPIQQPSNSADLFWSNQQQSIPQQQQSTSNSLFDFGTTQTKQQPNTMDLFAGLSAPNQPNQQQNSVDIFSSMNTPSQQTSTPQTNSNTFDFGDFSSAQVQEKKQSDWRANIKIDSIQDTRKQQPASQQKQTLGQFL
ncbi:ENTH domain-containing protein C794.11C, putative [Entamoeba dispar SAW760]|uniref:ENTH domain-containing protein C794.11C, putative n=2 Tax=Entamoeba TaxID=5758 RepID=B0E9H8_ENTDS|nr:ENTH domain-containing protein C794.11C, putative [Entamoeba dispar SAW760]EDR28785.1 ENTH domain-containing protein C794.11C, putative [Entamoeba dispar SAW760]|eukprot:EDR28785.1 ENTH domain-containing protein C794.11C, putative [Entamoeba dispar SAW760]